MRYGTVLVRESVLILPHENMRTMRKLGIVVLTVVTVALAACTTTTIRPTGIVTGYADACEGPVLPTGQTFHVKVSLYSGSRPVASETVRSGAKYRFSVHPGPYRVAGWWGSRAATVGTNDVATVNIVDFCK